MDEQKQMPPAPYAAGTGSVPVTPDRAAFDRMGYRERLALKRENPEVYQEMKKEAASPPPRGREAPLRQTGKEATTKKLRAGHTRPLQSNRI